MQDNQYSRTIETVIDNRISHFPVVLITGARQIGKSTLSYRFTQKGYTYISFDDPLSLSAARKDPQAFLAVNPGRLILDEIQRAPELFPYLEKAVNEVKISGRDNSGMFLLTGSRIYSTMDTMRESLAGRLCVVNMSTLSRDEIIGREEPPFSFDKASAHRRAQEHPLGEDELLELVFRGQYPRLWEDKSLDASTFYRAYIDTYLMRDISDLRQIRDQASFTRFLTITAAYTGQELVYDSISKAVGVDSKTIRFWIDALVSCGIVTLIHPYSDTSIVKRIVKRPKLYFTDTGLVCSLIGIDSPETLRKSFLYGSIFETYAVNEIMKSFRNNGMEPSIYYYRDTSQNEVDLVLIDRAEIHPIEIKSGTLYTTRDIKAFMCLDNLKFPLGDGAIICTADQPYPVTDRVWTYPIGSL